MNYWIHASKPPESACIKQISAGFKNVAEELGFKVGRVHKEINISNPRMMTGKRMMRLRQTIQKMQK
ncbi:hypothetical protein AB3S75_002279 [Citrus x aurantiifolia]